MKTKCKGYGTLAIHAGNLDHETFGAIATPIYQSSTFCLNSCEIRIGNPTTSVLESKVAALENAEDAVAFASGMGAISTCIWSIASTGKHIVADEALYGSTFEFLNYGITRYGVKVSFVDTSDLQAVKDALRPNTCCVYIETPSDPNLKIVDIEKIAGLVHSYNRDIKLVVDNTFATPCLTRPLELGADIVVHSATNYLNGHGDVIAGFVCGRKNFMDEVRNFGLKDITGAVLDPFAAFLILRGLKTLELRIQRHCENAMQVAQYLDNHRKVAKVYFPGLKSHIGHDIALKQMHGGFGGMISFEVRGGKEAGLRLCDELKLIAISASLGDAQTLIEHPASLSTPEELKAVGISDGLVRLSVGLENAVDIIDDLDQAFRRI